MAYQQGPNLILCVSRFPAFNDWCTRLQRRQPTAWPSRPAAASAGRRGVGCRRWLLGRSGYCGVSEDLAALAASAASLGLADQQGWPAHEQIARFLAGFEIHPEEEICSEESSFCDEPFQFPTRLPPFGSAHHGRVIPFVSSPAVRRFLFSLFC